MGCWSGKVGQEWGLCMKAQFGGCLPRRLIWGGDSLFRSYLDLTPVISCIEQVTENKSLEVVSHGLSWTMDHIHCQANLSCL